MSYTTASGKTWQAPAPTFWERTLGFGGKAYDKALKPGFDKAYAVVDKLGAPINKFSNRIGSEAFWPTTLDKESEKCARILRSFCKDGFYEQIEEEATKKALEERKDVKINVPAGKQMNLVKIPAKVIQNCVGLAIFTTMRTGWILGGSGGAGVVVARHPETREWSPPSGIMTQNYSVGFLIGVDIYDTILVINSYSALEAFTRLRCTLGAEVGVVAGPVGTGSTLDSEFYHKPAPVWSYVKGRGLYAGIALAGNAIIERSDENEKFYNQRVPASDILAGKVRHPPVKDYKILMDTLLAAQGDAVDESLLPAGETPSDMDVDLSQGSFGIPAEDDDDPYGVKALEAEGLHIREAGTHQRASADMFEFKPAPSSPIYPSYRRSIDSGKRRTGSWRNSSASLSSMPKDTPTTADDYRSPLRMDSKPGSRNESPESIQDDDKSKTELLIDRDNPIHQASLQEKSMKGTDEEAREEIVNQQQEHEKEEQEHDEHHDQSEHEDHDEELSDLDSDVEIGTAVTTIARPQIVNVPKREAPALPPRNPGRPSSRNSPRPAHALPPAPIPVEKQEEPQPHYFTVKFQTNESYPLDSLVLRTSLDDWSVDRPGELDHNIWHFKLDTDTFNKDFECKFVFLPSRWMHNPNIHVVGPKPGDDITFTDSRVIFEPAKEGEPTFEEWIEEQRRQETAGKVAESVATDDEDRFVSVPPTPDIEKEQPNGM